MTITITIDTGNAAFQDDETSVFDNESTEVIRILRDWLSHGSALRADVRPLYDYNGNKVGRIEVTR